MIARRERQVFVNLLATAVLAVGVSSTVWGQEGRGIARERQLARVADVHRRHADRILEMPEVVGVAVGVDWLETPVLKVFTRKGRPAGLPKTLEGVKVEIIETGEIFAIPPYMEERPLGAATLATRPAADKPPTVRFTSPKDGGTFVGIITLTVDARDDKGVRQVNFYYQLYEPFWEDPKNNPPQLLGTDTYGSDGWSYSWDTTRVDATGTPLYPDARYIVWAEAVDTKGQKASHNIALFVDNTPEEPPKYSPDRLAYSPISPIGVSVGNQNQLSAGTLGCVVADSDSAGVRRYYILSNNHVLALENTAPIGSWIFQPGLYDTGGGIPYAWMRVGFLTRYVSITFSRGANNQVDAAIARVEKPGPYDFPLVHVSTPEDGYGSPKAAHITNSELESIFRSGSFGAAKYGRTTGLTTGRVTGINATVLVSYSRGTARFVNQIVVESSPGFILPGDSGSLLVYDPQDESDGRRPVGLLFAGNTNGSIAFANRIEEVLNALKVRIVGE